eukprot:scaffold2879_cov269-Prasinococcus_capsulatus_cf.AAC.18
MWLTVCRPWVASGGYRNGRTVNSAGSVLPRTRAYCGTWALVQKYVCRLHIAALLCHVVTLRAGAETPEVSYSC